MCWRRRDEWRHTLTYTPRPDATPEGEIAALASVYRLILDCHTKKKGTRPGAPDDGTKLEENSANTAIKPK